MSGRGWGRGVGEGLWCSIYLQGAKGRMCRPECGPMSKNALRRGSVRYRSFHGEVPTPLPYLPQNSLLTGLIQLVPLLCSRSSASFGLEVFAYNMTHYYLYLWCLNPFHLGPFLLSISMFSLCLIWMTRPSRQEQYLS